jgi:type VI protein secretion system component Hcp
MSGTKSFMTLDTSMFTPNNGHGSTISYATGLMEIDDWECKIEQEGSQDGGKPRSVERVKHGEFTCKRKMDSRSPKLFYFCASGTFIGQAQLQVFGATNDPFLTISMSWVHISSYEPHSSESVPMETFGVRYGEMQVKWSDGALGGDLYGYSTTNTGSITTSWSWVCETPTHSVLGVPDITT